TVTTIVWLATTWLTRPESDATLQAFYRRVRPHGPGWTPIANVVGLPAASPSLAKELLNALLGCILVYAALFGVGELLLRSAIVGISLLGISVVAAAAIARNLESATEGQPTS